jgi:hypothetical protein
VIRALTDDQLLALTAQQVAALTLQQMAALKPSDSASQFTAAQMAAFSGRSWRP